ncbi:nucleotide-binding domain-containing protein [Mytilinidion resinicola]|uniref:Nucleotide-binding domain-containing protein n=1 Tax=Mytilinidion resinicola TaxID=574789 RepID=A0A6A6Z1U9_9PEZI|nr:nucleotide-binding domain-containing protein [Mytilinidion resinicola]KAF2814264.1 nucleotide-binding domain-containing protein [Mytilinidion resinicola]
MDGLTHDSSILIIGGGTWGCSIALQLARRGYRNINVLDASEFPSPIAAGNDINKIAEEANPPSEDDSDENYMWNRIHQMSMHAWLNDDLLKPFYHSTGFIMAACGDDAYKHVLEYAAEEKAELVPLKTADDFQKTMPKGVLTGSFPKWRGYWKKKGAGWLFARGALEAMHTESIRLGAKYVTGGLQGKVDSLIISSSAEDARTIIGAKTADGADHKADYTVLAAGANSDVLLDFKKQLRPTAWTLAHLPMSIKEARIWGDLPVLYGVDRGFFIEPDEEKHELKICDEHPGYCNFVEVDQEVRSVPFARQQIPVDAEHRMRVLLAETVPHLADRPFNFARICWDADTVDRFFLIDRHPEISNLLVAVGGSGHGFMTNPAVGVIAVDALEGVMELRLQKMMKWRPENAVGRDWCATQNRFGADGKIMDLSLVKDWTKIEKPNERS